MDNSSISESVNYAINSLYGSLTNSINGDSVKILDNIVFIDSSIMNNKYFKLFINSQSFNILAIVNSLMIAFLLYYIISYFFSKFSGTNVENPFQFIFKFIICVICVNSSYFICEQIINIFDIMTDTLREFFFTIFTNENLSFELLYKELNSLYTNENIASMIFFSFDGIIRLFLSLGFFNLLFTYSYRFILVKLLLLLSPFFILTLSLNSTKWLFKMWLKNLLSLLSIQLIIAILFSIILTLKYNFDESTIKVLYIGSLFTIMKASSFIKDFSSGFTSDVSSGMASFRNLFN